MTRTEPEEVSWFTWGTALLRHRWRIARAAFVGALVAALVVSLRPTLYVATASFIPQGGDPSRSSLADLAGQLGVAIPQANQSLSPEFYTRILTSRILLNRIVRDSFTVDEKAHQRISFLDLFEVPGRTHEAREENGRKVLIRAISTSIAKPTGVVEVDVATKWPSVSLSVVSMLVNGVNDFNQQTRQSQATAERKFVEARLALAASDLRASEDRLEDFLRSNRQFVSPELTFQRERLQRDVTLHQQLFTSLTQSYEEVRIREVRDTPVITVIEPPAVDSVPKPAGRVVGVFVGLILGAFVGLVLVVTRETTARRRSSGDPAALEFVDTVDSVKREMVGRAKRIGGRMKGSRP
jgi:uncharacterized protein involved in exopolysaccharide biosynthesis